jgi:hypothetical protein
MVLLNKLPSTDVTDESSLCVPQPTTDCYFFQGLKLVLSSVALEEEAMEIDNQQDPNGDK